MQLDVNTEVYPIKQEERYAVKLTTTLDLDGTPDTAYYTPIKPGSIADNFDYIMHGKLYKILDEAPSTISRLLETPEAFTSQLAGHNPSYPQGLSSSSKKNQQVSW
ncbi:hypothetical protein D5086_024928 [Populus alba]|uniref:Uncharacterized protein n=1 Tax=Populus alba TaxID=43335 RepID=A0ACC4B7I5_POPAL